MAKQDGGRPNEAQPKSSLPIPPGIGAHYRRVQDFVEPLGAISKGGKVEAVPASTQRTGRLNRIRGSEGRFHKATFRYNQCHPGCPGKD